MQKEIPTERKPGRPRLFPAPLMQRARRIWRRRCSPRWYGWICMKRKPMLRDENAHGDKDCKREDQGGCPNATAPRREIARAGVRQIARRCGAATGRPSREEAGLGGVSGSAVVGPRKAAVLSDRAGAAEGFRAAQACRVAECVAPALAHASIPPSTASALGTRGRSVRSRRGASRLEQVSPISARQQPARSGQNPPGLL